MKLLSLKHIAPCPACGRHSQACPGHDWKALARAGEARRRDAFDLRYGSGGAHRPGGSCVNPSL